MRRVHLAEIRSSWRAWLSVSLVFVTINASLTMTAITYWTGHVAVRDGRLEWLESAYYMSPKPSLPYSFFSSLSQ